MKEQQNVSWYYLISTIREVVGETLVGFEPYLRNFPASKWDSKVCALYPCPHNLMGFLYMAIG